MHRRKFTNDWGNVVSHFPNRVYNGLEDLAETIMNHANSHSSRVMVSVKETLTLFHLSHFIFTQAL